MGRGSAVGLGFGIGTGCIGMVGAVLEFSRVGGRGGAACSAVGIGGGGRGDSIGGGTTKSLDKR